jgi:hypothetical protein
MLAILLVYLALPARAWVDTTRLSPNAMAPDIDEIAIDAAAGAGVGVDGVHPPGSATQDPVAHLQLRHCQRAGYRRGCCNPADTISGRLGRRPNSAERVGLADG